MRLPLDCIGEIVQYLSDHRILYNILLVSKRVKNFIENEQRSTMNNIQFPICVKYLCFNKIVNYIKFDHLCTLVKLQEKITSRTIFSHMLYKLYTVKTIDAIADNFDCTLLKHFINLENVTIVKKNIMLDTDIGSYVVEELNNLVVLNMENIVVNHNNHLIWKKRLKMLIVCSIHHNVSEDIFMNMQDLRYLYVDHVSDYHATGKTFKYLKNLRSFCMPDLTVLHDDDLKYVGKSIERLYINSCRGITDKGLSYINHKCKINLWFNTKITREGIRKNKYLFEPVKPLDKYITVEIRECNFWPSNGSGIHVNLQEYKDKYHVYCQNIDLDIPSHILFDS